MTSQTHEGLASTTATTSRNGGGSKAASEESGIGGTVADAAGTVRGAAGDAVAKLPDAVATTRSAIEDANRQMRAGSDEMLTVGSVLSFGFAMGLLIGGANRLLVAGALIPAAMMSLTLLDRSSQARSKTRGL